MTTAVLRKHSPNMPGVDKEAFDSPHPVLLHPEELDGDMPVKQIVLIPDDLPVARLKTINLGRLEAGDQAEASSLYSACIDDGVFYLDFHTVESDVLQAIDQIYMLERQLFALPYEEKIKFDVDKPPLAKISG